MLEENNLLLHRITIQDYLKYIDLDIDCENVLDYIYNSKNSYCLSQFPQYVSDAEKYNSLEVFYQKYLDKDITKFDFLECEKKYHNVSHLLWLYDQVYVGIYTDESSYKKSYYAKKNKLLFRKQQKFIVEIIKNHRLLHSINALNKLNAIMHIGTRDIAPVVLFFKKFKSMIYFSGCSAMVYSKSEEFINLVKTVALPNGLFLLKGQQEHRRQGDNSLD